jgi:hypothetical protein
VALTSFGLVDLFRCRFLRPSLQIAILTVLLGGQLIAARSARATDPVPATIDFNRQIRPILSANCFACHGPDVKARKAKLRLDIKQGALALSRSGGPIILPGKSSASELIGRITARADAQVMPPPASGKKLTQAEIDLLRRWVDQGAPWATHWAFVPPQRPAPPRVTDRTWVRNAIDRFILSPLEARGWKPSPEADKATLLRRLTLDLTGLPPTPDEVDAFLADSAPNAYERVVDRLLGSPRYGEQMALHWLDAARYADSNGYEDDYERFMWRWRDWVIDAFNRNMPFDQFTIEQLAGDLLPQATLDQRIATGFNRNHRINTEDGVIAEEWRVETVVDRVETTASVWLGLTMGCARCHDHKYDPITQKEFYQFFAFFNNVAETGSGPEQPVNHPPFIAAPRPFEQTRLRALEAAIARAAQEVKEKEPRLAELQGAWEKTAAVARPSIDWVVLAPKEVTSAAKAKLEMLPDKSIRAAGANKNDDRLTVVAEAGLKEIIAVRLEILDEDRSPLTGGNQSTEGTVLLADVGVQVNGRAVKLVSASSTYSQPDHPITAAIDSDPKTGWSAFPHHEDPHYAVFAFDKPIPNTQPTKVVIRLELHAQSPQHQRGRFRLSITGAGAPHDRGGIPVPLLNIVRTPTGQRTAAQQKALTAYFRAHHAGAVTEADRKLRATVKAKQAYETRLPTVMVMADLPAPRAAFILVRGQYDRHGEKVSSGLPAALWPKPGRPARNRLDLARWLVDPNHPLTTRVAVNRLWEQFFGVGLVKTTEDFGTQGEPPSHPELLDWLATEFVRLGWDLKALQKVIVMSATYRQASNVSPGLQKRDPENRWLARGPRFRLQAELIRDNALAISGLLVDQLGGPSVRPYQPAGVWNETSSSGNLQNYQHDQASGLYRRSVYTMWKRTAAPPTMLLFDSPSREVCQVKRSRTNTPLQALALLNEVTFVEAARMLAERMLTQGGSTPEQRITYGFRRATARLPSADELRVLAVGLSQRLTRYRNNTAAAKKLLRIGDSPHGPQIDAAELAAYTLTASVILNLDETITKE